MKQTFEQYVRTEVLSGIKSMSYKNDKKTSMPQKDDKQTPEKLARLILKDFLSTQRESIFKLFADADFFTSFVSAHTSLKKFESYRKEQLTDAEFLSYPSVFFKNAIKYIVMYNIILCFGEDFEKDVKNKSFIVDTDETVRSLTYIFRDLDGEYSVPFTK